MRVYEATEDWIQHFEKHKEHMYMTLSQADVLILLNYLRAVGGMIVEYKNEKNQTKGMIR